jgi:hypothetical protein
MPGFVNYKKGCNRLAATSDKVYQLLAHGRCFSPGTTIYKLFKLNNLPYIVYMRNTCIIFLNINQFYQVNKKMASEKKKKAEEEKRIIT